MSIYWILFGYSLMWLSAIGFIIWLAITHSGPSNAEETRKLMQEGIKAVWNNKRKDNGQ